MVLSSGSHLGNHEILEPLGVGGMGEVCSAGDVKLLGDRGHTTFVFNFFDELERLAPTR